MSTQKSKSINNESNIVFEPIEIKVSIHGVSKKTLRDALGIKSTSVFSDFINKLCEESKDFKALYQPYINRRKYYIPVDVCTEIIKKVHPNFKIKYVVESKRKNQNKTDITG